MHLVESMGFTMVTFAPSTSTAPSTSQGKSQGVYFISGPFGPFSQSCCWALDCVYPPLDSNDHISHRSAGDVTHLWTPKPIAKGRFWSPVKFWLENSFPFGFRSLSKGGRLNLGVSNPLKDEGCGCPWREDIAA